MLALILAATCFFWCANRLRLISWWTTRPFYVAMYLLFAAWSLWIGDYAIRGELHAYQLIGIVAALCWLYGSRNRWRGGPPADSSRPAPLDQPLRRIFK